MSRIFAVLLALLFAAGPCWAQTPEQQRQMLEQLRTLNWQRGPSSGRIGGLASVRIPAGYVFLDEKDSERFLQIMGNPPSAGNYTFAPDTLRWFAVFHFNQSGYVKDDERIDPDALLRALKQSDGPANEERRRLGMEQLTTEGWLVPPHYDIATKRLEWGVQLRGERGDQTINYTTRLLGRTGVMAATLVSSPNQVGADMEVFRNDLAGFAFSPGQTYAEFRSGDKVAEYGLGALIVGGAAAAATKTGLLKSLAKFVWVGILAGLAALRSIWKKVTGNKG